MRRPEVRGETQEVDIRTYEAIADYLARVGVRDVFTFASSDIIYMLAELAARGVKVHHTRQENFAVGMADGYARVSGRVGVAIVGKGAGFTSTANALVTAAKARSQVLVLTGEGPGPLTPAAALVRKHVDQRLMLDALGVRHVELSSPNSAVADVGACFELAARGDDAIVVNMALEILEAEAGTSPSRLSVDTAQGSDIQEDQLRTVVELLDESWTSRHTVILAGRGAVRSGARSELLRLGEATGALLATTVMANALFAGERYSVGVVGTFANPVALELLGRADLVLAFGASLNYDTTYDATIFGKARIVQIDVRSSSLARYGPVDLGIVADARLAAISLANELERREHHVQGYRTADVATQLAQFRIEETFEDRSGPDGLDPRTLMVALDKLLPSERTVAIDAGAQKYFPNRYLSVPDPAGYVWPIEYGSLGGGLGGALGAAVARPDRLTVLCIGDGGLMWSLSDLETAARYKLRLLVVVHNNSGLAAEVHHLLDRGYPPDQGQYANPSFAAVARSLGFQAATIERIADLEALRDEIQCLNGPMLLDCKVSPAQLERSGRFDVMHALKQAEDIENRARA